jgi:hypothetical protein
VTHHAMAPRRLGRQEHALTGLITGLLTTLRGAFAGPARHARSICHLLCSADMDGRMPLRMGRRRRPEGPLEPGKGTPI